MLQSSIFRGLLDQLAAEDDPAKRAELIHKAEHQYDLDMEHQANFVQNRIGALELDIREQVAQSLGAQHDMISQVAADSRKTLEVLTANTAVVEGLSQKTEAGFRRTDTRLEEVGTAVDGLRKGQQRITERVNQLDKRHQEQWEEVIKRFEADERRLDEKRARIEALEQQVKDLTAGSPILEPTERAAMAAWLVEFIRREMAREAGDGE